MAGDQDIDVARHALEQPQPGEVIPDGIGRAFQVEHRNQDIGKHVADDKNPAFLNQQRRMAEGMRPTLDNPDLRAITGNLRRAVGQAGNEAQRVQRYLLWDADRLCDGIHPAGQPVQGSSGAARGAVPGASPNPACQSMWS